MNESSAYIGLDVHKDTVAVAVALPGREEPVYRGEIKNQRKSLHRLIRSLSPDGGGIEFLLRSGTVRLRGVSGDCRDGSPVRGGGAEPDSASQWGAGEDGPARCADAGAVASCGGASGGVGA